MWVHGGACRPRSAGAAEQRGFGERASTQRALLPLLLRGAAMVATVLAISAWSADAHAYAWMIKHGMAKCNSCHTDPSGGETLTHMGRVSSETLLSGPFGDGSAGNSSKLFGFLDEPDTVRLGGSLRAMGILDTDSGAATVFPMQADFYGQADFGSVRLGWSLGGSRASERYEHTSKAVLFADVEEKAFVPVSRTHWLGYEFNDNLLLRAGRLNLPFGMRVPNHVLWVRDDTTTDRESDQQHGLALAYSGGHWRGEFMVSLGNFQLPNDANRERGYSGHVEYLLNPRMAIGVSSLVLAAAQELLTETPDVLRQAHGVTGRFGISPELAVLAEFNVTKRSNFGIGYVGMLQADYEFLRGLHLTVTGEILDSGLKQQPASVTDVVPAAVGATPTAAQALAAESALSGQGEPRLGVWGSVSWYLLSHLDLRLDLVARQDRPLTAHAQFHYYF